MLSLSEYKTNVSNGILPFLSKINDLSAICADYLVPKMALDQKTWRDMWIYALLRFTDYLAIPEALRHLPDPKPEFGEQCDIFAKWQAEHVKRLDQSVFYPPNEMYGIRDKSGALTLKATKQSIRGYLYYNGVPPVTWPWFENPSDQLTFRVLCLEFYEHRVWDWDRIMGFDLIGVDSETGCGIFGVADFS